MTTDPFTEHLERYGLLALGSTTVGEAVDTLIFLLIAFVGILPGQALLIAILTQWLIKVGYEALALPATYWLVRAMRKQALSIAEASESM